MIWLSVKEVSDLECISESAVKKRIKNTGIKGKDYHHINSSTGQGGKNLEINLEFLSEQAQAAYHNKNGECLPVVNTEFAYSTKKQKSYCNTRSRAIIEFKKYRVQAKKNGISSEVQIKNMFIEKWNRENPNFNITVKTLYEWLKKTETGDVNKLIDQRGGSNRGKSSIPKYYQDYFKSIYLQQTKPSVESCFNETRLEANLRGNVIPGIKAFRLLVKNMDNSMVTRAREGKKAFEDKCMPYVERDYTKLKPNDWWVSDHHLWDVFVRIPDGKGGWRAARPWGSYWMDMRTRKFVSSIIRTESPNSDVVLCSFGLGVEHFGVPRGVRLDNGKDYKANDMFLPEGKYLCSDDDVEFISNSLASNLQIDVTYAIPYNAKAKPIERAFHTFIEQFAKMFSSYAGCNAKARPEDLKDLDIMNMPTLEEFIELHNRYVYEIYNESSHKGDGMFNNSPNYMYSKLDFTIRRVQKDVLYFSLMRAKGQRVVDRNGITFNKIHYDNENCINYIKQKVFARYDPTKPKILYVFDKNENFLFIAHEVPKNGWTLTEEDYERENHRKKVARQKSLNSYTADNVIRSTESISDRLKRQADSIEKSQVAKPKTVEIIRNEKIEENVKRISISDIERNYEDVIAQNEAQKKEVTSKQKELADRFKQNMLDRANKTSKQA